MEAVLLSEKPNFFESSATGARNQYRLTNSARSVSGSCARKRFSAAASSRFSTSRSRL